MSPEQRAKGASRTTGRDTNARIASRLVSRRVHLSRLSRRFFGLLCCVSNTLDQISCSQLSHLETATNPPNQLYPYHHQLTHYRTSLLQRNPGCNNSSGLLDFALGAIGGPDRLQSAAENFARNRSNDGLNCGPHFYDNIICDGQSSLLLRALSFLSFFF